MRDWNTHLGNKKTNDLKIYNLKKQFSMFFQGQFKKKKKFF